MKQTGIELIAQERKEQIEKHGISVEEDVEVNVSDELRLAAHTLTSVRSKITVDGDLIRPFNPWPWKEYAWVKICKKSYKDRLVVAGALIAAEIDRLQAIEE